MILSFVFAAAALATNGYPREVALYIERREKCEHFRHEPWPEGASVEEKERRQLLVQQFANFCHGSDLTMRELKKKYENNRLVMDKLQSYEADIEVDQ